MEALEAALDKDFQASTNKFFEIVNRLSSQEVRQMDHSELEVLVREDGRELQRLLLQEHLDLRSPGRTALSVVGSEGVERTESRPSDRGLKTVVGEVRIDRMGYGKPGVESLFPLDAELNLPRTSFSFGVRRELAIEVSKNSYAEAVEAVKTNTGIAVGMRQAEEEVIAAAQDFESFYAAKATASAEESSTTGELAVVTLDQKGVVMKKEDLREETRKRAEAGEHKLDKRLSKGEKKNAKRLATVAAVYTIKAFPRVPADILRELRNLQDVQQTVRRPRPEGKRVWATLEMEMEEVVEAAFQETFRRDPEGTKRWVALVDGNKTQIDLLEQQAAECAVELTVVLDIIHVIEYVWKAAYVFHPDGSKEAEAWVTERVARILDGKASDVAAGMRRSATLQGITKQKRKAVDDCARYMLNNAKRMRYNEYLQAGLPIATGVIEGACRHLIKDRMDVTGARWSLKGAEAVLRLRSLRSSNDFAEYWKFHQAKEFQRNHSSRYHGGDVPHVLQAPALNASEPPRLRVIK